MEEIIDLIATDSSASQISDRIKDALYSKAAEMIDAARPIVASSLFGENEPTDEYTEDQE
jgi:hypothetical protein